MFRNFLQVRNVCPQGMEDKYTFQTICLIRKNIYKLNQMHSN